MLTGWLFGAKIALTEVVISDWVNLRRDDIDIFVRVHHRLNARLSGEQRQKHYIRQRNAVLLENV